MLNFFLGVGHVPLKFEGWPVLDPPSLSGVKPYHRIRGQTIKQLKENYLHRNENKDGVTPQENCMAKAFSLGTKQGESREVNYSHVPIYRGGG